MVENLMIQSIESDNRNIVNFSDKYLPRFGRHGELFVVNGILYIFADFDNSNHGKWFPLSNEKEIFSYIQLEPDYIWNIPIDFQTDNIQIIVYDENDKIYPYTYDISIGEKNIQLVFENNINGSVHLIINKAFDWVDRRFIVADRNFAVTEDENDINLYYLEIDTAYVEILKNGNTTLKKDLKVDGKIEVSSITNVNKLIVEVSEWIQGNLEVDGDTTIRGNTVIEGNLTVNGITTTINTTEISLTDNVLTLNSDAVGVPSLSASIDINRGDEGILSILKFDEAIDSVTVSVKKDNGNFIQEEIATKNYVLDEILTEKDRAIASENLLQTNLDVESNRIDNEIVRATTSESLLQNDIDARATIENTYNKNDIDIMKSELETLISDSVPTSEEILLSIKNVHGVDSGLDADKLDGLDSTAFNQVLGITEVVNTSGAEIISALILEKGVITGYETRNLTLSDLGYTEQQAISTILGLQDLLSNMISRIEALEAKT